MKKTSAGVVITDGTLFLIGHATGKGHWDFPKGQVDPGEEPIDAAIRELKEETTLVAVVKDLSEIGVFKYRKDKDLWLWLWKVSEMPDPSLLKCESTFTDPRGKELTEIDKFAVVDFNTMTTMVSKSLHRVIKNIDFTKL